MIRVSEHAIEQYKNRLGRKSVDPEQEIIELYYEAQEDNNPGLVKRRIKYLDDTQYYKVDNWRLVVVNGTIVTVERDSFNYSGLGFYKNPQKRSKKAWKWKKKNR